MINGGNATIYVSDFEGAVKFYTEVLGLELGFRAENHWAEVVAGKGVSKGPGQHGQLVIGIHPVTPHSPAGGVAGSVQIGLGVDEPLETVLQTLQDRGAAVEPIVADPNSGYRFAYLKDPEGNGIYLWETRAATSPTGS